MINIFGVVGQEIRAQDVVEMIAYETSDTIEVNIMSPGGSVVEGFAIYDALRASDKKVITRAIGIAASISSVIFMAGDERYISENAEIMIHNAWTPEGGNKEEMAEKIDRLERLDDRIATVYATRTNLNEDQVKEMMGAESFMSANEALEKGFATQIDEPLEMVAQLNLRESLIKEKEPENMAEETKDEKGFFDHVKAFFLGTDEVKAEAEEPKAEDEEKKEVAEEEEMEEAKAEETPAESAEEEVSEEKAEDEEEEMSDSEKALQEENDSLKAEIEAMKAKASEGEEKAKIIMNAINDCKITRHEADTLAEKALKEVEAFCNERAVNATGLAKPASEPQEEANVNHYDEWKAMLAAGDFSGAQKYYESNKAKIRNNKES